MNVPDHCIVLIKSMHVDFKRPSKGAMTATATLTPEQQQLMQTTARGETLVSVTVMDEWVKHLFNVKCYGHGSTKHH